MDSGLGLAKFLFPQIPSLANTAVWHTLGRTPTSSKWDLRTELTVQVLRHMMNGKPSTVGKAQKATLRDPGVKGKTWVATAKIEAPQRQEESLREAVFQAIEDMKPADAGALSYTRPDLEDIEVEWTGFRPDAGKEDPLPSVSEDEKYKRMMAEPSRTSEVTILYFHGGAYYLCDPSTHRAVCSRLAKESHGRVCSVRYRLAPQIAFPGQLLDALMIYLSLLHPPPGSMHEAVPAKNIVLSGDSAGGNLTFALLQLLLQLHRAHKNPTVLFHGKDVEVPLPAGACAHSGWFDITRSMPSLLTNAKYDYLPPPDNDDPALSRAPADSIWPTDPPRGDLFCDLSLMDHPLTSPLGAESWKDSPPMWFSMGQEMLADEIKVVASQAASQGVNVQLEEYEAMPHVFAMLLPTLSTSNRCMKSWGDFCRRCVEDPATIKTNGISVRAKTGDEADHDVSSIATITRDEAREAMKEAQEKRAKVFERTQQSVPKSSL